VEIASLAAPRPMLLISDGKDWTKNTPNVEYPYVQHIYKLYKKEKAVENLHLPEEGHDYGPSKRQGAYRFLAKHLKLSLKELADKQGNIDETFVKVEPAEVLRVFDVEHPRPENAIEGNELVSKLVESL
jgi:hypothetical protein